jgi:hypothetical protein
MQLPFATDQFLAVFAGYNNAIWPFQIVLNLLGLVAIALALWSGRSSRIIAGILAFLWAWTGAGYHLSFFAAINPAAVGFGSLCLLQALVFLIYGTVMGKLEFRFAGNIRGYAGAVLLLYAMVLYPLLGYLLGHQFPQSPTFGAPCPTTIFTFGILLWTTGKVHWYIFILAFLWALIGFTAAFKFGILEDIGLLVAGVVGSGMLLANRGGDDTAALRRS